MMIVFFIYSTSLVIYCLSFSSIYKLQVNINAYTLESIAIVNLNVGDKFEADGTVRVGASFQMFYDDSIFYL
jgi:hypothetical protein